MIVYEEMSLQEFPFWGPAETYAEYLTNEDFKVIEQELELTSDTEIGISKTYLNDLFSYDEDYIANILGYNNFDELREERS